MLRRNFLSASAFALVGSVAGSRPNPGIGVFKSIIDYGAQPDGKTLNTRMIQRAIDDVTNAGGGVVYAPPGVFLVGGLELKSRVTLYLEAGCTLLGSTDFGDYDYHPGPPMQGDANGHHLLFAGKAEDVTLCGPGTIDGQGMAYWELKGIIYLVKDKDNRRPSPMLEFAECRNVRISEVTLKNSAGWCLRPIACETVVIDGVRIRNHRYGPNTDGIDITASSNVLVSNCDIDTGDDAICIKSENPYGALLPTKNLTITNCVLKTTCNGFKIGTASAGIIENVVFSNSVIYTGQSNPLETHKVGGINIECVDGGSVEGVLVSNVRIQNAIAPIFVRLGERGKKAGTFLRNVLIENLDATGAMVTSSVTGVPGLRPSDITVSNCRIRTMAQGKAEWARREIPELADKYPEANMMGPLPAYGFFIRHADRVRLRNVEFITDKPDERPAVLCDDAKDLIFAGLEATAPVGDAAVIELRNTHRVFLTGMRMPVGAKVLAQIGGADSSGISFAGNSFEPDGQKIIYTDGATAQALGI